MGAVLIVKDLTSEYTLIYLELKYIANIAMATLQVRKNPCQPWSAKSEHARHSSKMPRNNFFEHRLSVYLPFSRGDWLATQFTPIPFYSPLLRVVGERSGKGEQISSF